jgi:tRNA threonylcarbamoyladenosine biosynthesis protein TsaE
VIIEIDSYSPEQTIQIGKQFAHFFLENLTDREAHLPPNIITLEGELGVGKTLFSRSIIHTVAAYTDKTAALPIVGSPTYNLLYHYPLLLPITHIDCYRINDEAELENIGIRDYFKKPGLILVEWASILEEFWKKSNMNILFLQQKNKMVLQFTLKDFYHPEQKKMLSQWLKLET